MPIKEYSLPLHTKLNRLWLRFGIRSIFQIFGRMKIYGAENVPLGTPYVIAMNHISIFDPPVAVCFWPEEPEVIGAANVFQKKGEGTILSLYGVIPVHRGEYDRTVLEKIIAVLKKGKPLVIAPEGGRSHTVAMRRAMPGLGYIIEHAQVPVIPVGILGTTGDFWQKAKRGLKPPIELRIGKPLQFPPTQAKGVERREARQQNADLVMRYIAGLLPPEYHGVYAG
ncbi:MAG: 1-acyl-sn-glycerol-3-phosphate acyltransferase, partial [Anaerolineales bacterium]|nr:1-acyl-sn-glycerol-3-phosphate acyltransferase [Anaerolineales bacterium]